MASKLAKQAFRLELGHCLDKCKIADAFTDTDRGKSGQHPLPSFGGHTARQSPWGKSVEKLSSFHFLANSIFATSFLSADW